MKREEEVEEGEDEGRRRDLERMRVGGGRREERERGRDRCTVHLSSRMTSHIPRFHPLIKREGWSLGTRLHKWLFTEIV